MIRLFTADTGNGHRVSIMLEEAGLPYKVVPIDFAASEHRGEALLAANPMGQIPAIVDDDGPAGQTIALAESSAILRYLARKSGKLLPQGPLEEMEADRWTAIAAGGLQAVPTAIFFAGMLGEEQHKPYIDHQRAVAGRYLAVMDARLAQGAYLAGAHCTFADILGFTLANGSLPRFGISLDPYPAVKRWVSIIAERPAVQRGLGIPAQLAR